MHHPSLLFAPLLLDFIIFFFFLLPSSSSSSSSSERSRYEDCAPFECGNSTRISYPFREKTQPIYCGRPGFDLTCDRVSNTTVLQLQSDSYKVLQIRYDLHRLLIVNKQFLSNACPQPEKNVTLDPSTPFSFRPSDQNFSLYSNCSKQIENSSFSLLPCISRHGRFAYFTNIYGDDKILSNCGYPVVLPIREKSVWGLQSKNLNFSEALRDGFWLFWEADECAACELSGGRCGNNGTTSSPDFICFCTDQEFPAKCAELPDQESSKTRVKFIAGISAAAGALFLAGIAGFIFFYICRRSEKQAVYLDRSISYKPATKPDYGKGSTTQSLTNMPAVSLFTYQELEQATNNFNPSNELGDGGFGTVYYGKLRDGRSVAVKRLYESNYKRVEQFMNEVKILSGLRHQNLVCLYGCTSRHSRELLLVYEYISNGTVADHLHSDPSKVKAGLCWSTRLKIAVETAEALAFLHAVEPPIIHRDVKTNNILLDSSYRVKVADFGLSRLFPMDATHVSTAPQGTPGYVDPDYHQSYQLTDKSDVYSFGVVLFELISSKLAVDISRDRDEINLANLAVHKIIHRALNELVDPSIGFESDPRVRRMVTTVADLAFRCLAAEKDERPPMEEVLEVLKGIEKDGLEDNIPREDADILTDEVGSSKTRMQVSPDSVTNKCSSKSTSPNHTIDEV